MTISVFTNGLQNHIFSLKTGKRHRRYRRFALKKAFFIQKRMITVYNVRPEKSNVFVDFMETPKFRLISPQLLVEWTKSSRSTTTFCTRLYLLPLHIVSNPTFSCAKRSGRAGCSVIIKYHFPSTRDLYSLYISSAASRIRATGTSSGGKQKKKVSLSPKPITSPSSYQ